MAKFDQFTLQIKLFKNCQYLLCKLQRVCVCVRLAAAAGSAEKYMLLDEERSKYTAADPYRPGRNEPLESSAVAAAASASYYDYSMVPSLGSTDI